MRSKHIEGSIEHLILRIACAGLEGSSVEDTLSFLSKTSDDAGNESTQEAEERRGLPTDTGVKVEETNSNLANEENANIWRWITSKPDVIVGQGRRWNHLSLDQVLALPEEPPHQDAAAPDNDPSKSQDTPADTAHQPASEDLPAYRPRLYLTESKLWECVAGHGVDYQKLPRFEWLALLGIASVMEKGILQGDLTRLVNQDKRSLPKRTDELARKGYVEKRPILARGCKTSKIWLKAFSPSTQVQKQSTDAGAGATSDTFPSAALVTDLEPVPWRDNWTGNTIDYAMLGRTVMAVVKEFGVIRYQDLREKLGVSGQHWQMKVLTRTCRFFIELGLLHYVTASLGNKLFRDCLKFKRDLTAEDLSAFISGGGSAFRFGNNHDPKKARAKKPEVEAIGSFPTEKWNPDKPLTISVLDLILASGKEGMTNKALAFNTIGGSLERHISAVSTAVSIKNSQPSHLRHLQARKDYCRSGRVAAYRFFPDGPSSDELRVQSKGQSDATLSIPSGDASVPPTRLALQKDYGFRAVNLQPQTRPIGLSTAETSVSVKRSRDGDDDKSRKRRKTGTTNGDDGTDVQATSEIHEAEPTESGEANIAVDIPKESASVLPKRKLGRPRKNAVDDDGILITSKPKKAKQWDCDKCGGTWKNDIGLKYHLTKSRTPCNPTYVDNPRPRAAHKPRGGKSRQAPRAVYRLGECEVLAQRKWKGDTALAIRQSFQRSTFYNTPSDPGRDLVQDDTRPSPDASGPSLPVTSIGGLIETRLAQSRNGATVSSSLKSKTIGPAKKRHDRDPGSPSASYTSPLRQRRAQEVYIPATPPASKRDATNGPSPETSPGTPGPSSSVAYEHHASAESNGDPYGEIRYTRVEDTGAFYDASTDLVAQPFEPSSRLKDDALVGDARDILRVREIVKYLLRSNGGAFPSRVSLWHAVVVVWQKAFPKDTIPSYPVSQRAVRELIKKRKATENMFAFRNALGSISDCYLLVEHGTDPNSPTLRELKTLMKSSHPKPYIPPAFAHSVVEASMRDDDSAPLWGTGRGKQVMSIEVLDAPVYINQVSQGRRMMANAADVDDEDGQLHCQEVTPISRAPPKSSSAFKPTPTSKWSPAATEWRTTGSSNAGVRFLKPNSHLMEEEDIAIDPALEAYRFPAAPGDPASPSKAVYGAADEGARSGRQQLTNVQFMQNAEIRGDGKEWPDLESEFFESGEGSFTLVGSTPHEQQGTQPGRQYKTWVPSQPGRNGPVYGPYLAQEHPNYLAATPVNPANTRGPASRGRPRIRRDNLPPRPKLKERTLTTIGPPNGVRPSSSPAVAPLSIGDFTAEEALTVAFVAVRLLLGGSNKAIDWGLVARLFPDQTLEDLRRFWIRLSKDRVHFLMSFTEKFQNEFLTAYENDELPPLDYDNILGYDWQRLVEWGVALRRTNFVKLPVRRSEAAGQTTMTRDFVLEDHPEQPRHWHERFFHYQASVFTRFELATSEAAAIKISSKKPAPQTPPPPAAEPSLQQEAISWVRALCCTATDRCAPEVVKNKLMTLTEDTSRVNAVLDEAVNDLNNRRVITKRIRDKPYMLSRPFQANLAKFGQERKFRGAAALKAALDGAFRRGGSFALPFVSDDGAQMALMNLYAHGRIDIAGVDIPQVPLGFRPGNYESRKMPKSHLIFDLVATPTGDYLYDDEIEVLGRARGSPPPAAADAAGRLLPFWLDFFGDVNPEMWTRLLGLVCFMLAIRGSMPFDMLYLQTKTYLEEFDLRLMVGWCRRVGLMVEDPRSGGLGVTEWWWLVVGLQRDWPEEVVGQVGEGRPGEGARKPRGMGRPRGVGRGRGRGKARKNAGGEKGKGKAVSAGGATAV